MSEPNKPPAIMIEQRCGCGGYLFVELHADQYSSVDKVCAVANGWTKAHERCSGSQPSAPPPASSK